MPWETMPRSLPELQIEDNDHLPAHQLLGFEELGDAGHDLSGAVLARIHLEHKQPVRLGMRCHFKHRAHAQIDLGKVLELDAVRTGHLDLGSGLLVLFRLGLLGSAAFSSLCSKS